MLKFQQSRVICCIFYSLDDIFLFIDRLKLEKGRYAYIYHDKDRKKDGSPKPPHYHFYARRQSPFTAQTLQRLIDKCQQNVFVENLKSTDHAVVCYFTHDEQQDKARYNIADIVANFDVVKFLDTPTSQLVDPAEIIAMYDSGFRTIDIIRRFPKLMYSVSSLLKVEQLIIDDIRIKREDVRRQQLKLEYQHRHPVNVSMSLITDDNNLPF